MPSLLDMGPYAGFDPRRSPHLLNNPPRDPSQVDASGAFLKGQAAGLLGFPADMVQMMADVQAGANRVAPMQVPFTSDKIGSLLGADPQTRDFQAGLIGAPDISDVGRLAGKGLLAQALFHGTPHKFDKFDLKAIGTGEGAQAYGHGLYFAESPGVAKSYQTQLTAKQSQVPMITLNGERKLVSDMPLTPEGEALLAFEHAEGSVKDARRLLASDPQKGALKWLDDNADGLEFSRASEGHLYEVDIPDETIGKMLDWDAPLSEQPESVRKALMDSWIADPEMAKNMTGEQIYKQLAEDKRFYSLSKLEDYNDRISELNRVMEADSGPGYRNFRSDKGRKAAAEYDRLMAERADNIPYDSTSMEGMQRLASEELRGIGIPGIRFWDGNSRNLVGGRIMDIEQTGGKFRSKVEIPNNTRQQGSPQTITWSPKFDTEAEARKWADKKISKGTRNIVVFNPDDIKTVKRDGELVYKTGGI